MIMSLVISQKRHYQTSLETMNINLVMFPKKLWATSLGNENVVVANELYYFALAIVALIFLTKMRRIGLAWNKPESSVEKHCSRFMIFELINI